MSYNTDRLKAEMHKATSMDELQFLLEQALGEAEFWESRWAFARTRAQKLRVRVENQERTIVGLQNALYGKKK